MYETVLLTFTLTSWLGLALYWIPASLCVYGYTIRTWKNYQKDVYNRDQHIESGKYYSPTDTIGTLIGRALVTVCPVANIWAATFDIAPKLFSAIFEWTGKVFDTPLVPGPK